MWSIKVSGESMIELNVVVGQKFQPINMTEYCRQVKFAMDLLLSIKYHGLQARNVMTGWDNYIELIKMLEHKMSCGGKANNMLIMGFWLNWE